MENKALWEVDFERNGMQWLESREQSIITFSRKGAKDYLIVISNFSEESYERYKMEVPEEGEYEEVLNTDRKEYGGRGVINKRMETEEHKLTMRIGPLATIYLKRAELTPRTR